MTLLATLAYGLAAAAVGAALASWRRQRRLLIEQAITDPLTGAFNRRHLDFCLEQAIRRRQRTGEPAALLLFDVDHFKRINDGFGHAAGDAALAGLAALVAACGRGLDSLFRIGGEEFVLLLPGATAEGALVVAENLRALVADAHLCAGAQLSISIGVSELHAGQSAAGWLGAADAALYLAKRAGRNRVSGAPDAPPLARPRPAAV